MGYGGHHWIGGLQVPGIEWFDWSVGVLECEIQALVGHGECSCST